MRAPNPAGGRRKSCPKVNEWRHVNGVTATPIWRAFNFVTDHTMRVPPAEAPVVSRARTLAADILSVDPALHEHTSRTARRAAELAQRIPGNRATDAVAAAWLHDIGYAPRLRRTGFHPLDGALFLMAEEWPERIVRLVAHHCLAALEAPFYGVGHHLGVIEVVTGIDADILVSADLSAGAGNPVPTAQARLEAMRLADEEVGLVPDDVREARYAGLRAAHARIESLI